MSIIRLTGQDRAPLSELAPSAVHWLPCSVAYNGPAQVSKFFDSHVTESEAGTSTETPPREGCFRGRGLKGAYLDLSKGSRGYVLENVGDRQAGPLRWEAKASFGGFTYWNHEGRPLDTDAQQRVFTWLPLAQKVQPHHSPSSPEFGPKHLQIINSPPPLSHRCTQRSHRLTWRSGSLPQVRPADDFLGGGVIILPTFSYDRNPTKK
jgi:hypothetical protein